MAAGRHRPEPNGGAKTTANGGTLLMPPRSKGRSEAGRNRSQVHPATISSGLSTSVTQDVDILQCHGSHAAALGFVSRALPQAPGGKGGAFQTTSPWLRSMANQSPPPTCFPEAILTLALQLRLLWRPSRIKRRLVPRAARRRVDQSGHQLTELVRLAAAAATIAPAQSLPDVSP